MQRFVNNPDFIVEDMIKGFVKAHKEIDRSSRHDHVVKGANIPIKGKVGIVSGGKKRT